MNKKEKIFTKNYVGDSTEEDVPTVISANSSTSAAYAINMAMEQLIVGRHKGGMTEGGLTENLKEAGTTHSKEEKGKTKRPNTLRS